MKGRYLLAMMVMAVFLLGLSMPVFGFTINVDLSTYKVEKLGEQVIVTIVPDPAFLDWSYTVCTAYRTDVSPWVSFGQQSTHFFSANAVGTFTWNADNFVDGTYNFLVQITSPSPGGYQYMYSGDMVVDIPLTISMSGNVVALGGQTAALSVSATDNEALTYSWIGAGIVGAADQPSVNVLVSYGTEETYTATVTSASGDVASGSVKVTEIVRLIDQRLLDLIGDLPPGLTKIDRDGNNSTVK